MLTDAQRAEGWIEHDGGECPVNPDAPVEIMVRGGAQSHWNHAGSVIWRYRTPIAEMGWAPMPRNCEVIAYRIEERGE